MDKGTPTTISQKWLYYSFSATEHGKVKSLISWSETSLYFKLNVML